MGMDRALLEVEGGFFLQEQFQSACRAVTRGCKSGWGVVTGGWECRWGWWWGVGILLGQSEGWSLRGEGVPHLPSSDSLGMGHHHVSHNLYCGCLFGLVRHPGPATAERLRGEGGALQHKCDGRRLDTREQARK